MTKVVSELQSSQEASNELRRNNNDSCASSVDDEALEGGTHSSSTVTTVKQVYSTAASPYEMLNTLRALLDTVRDWVYGLYREEDLLQEKEAAWKC